MKIARQNATQVRFRVLTQQELRSVAAAGPDSLPTLPGDDPFGPDTSPTFPIIPPPPINPIPLPYPIIPIRR